MSTGKWNAVILSIACGVLGLALGFVLGGLFAPPVIGEPWLKSYQGLLAAFLALSAAGFGLVVATWNVLRQLRINLMSREEDRMERDLGSLKRVSAELKHLREMLWLSPDEGRLIYQNLDSFLPGHAPVKDLSEVFRLPPKERALTREDLEALSGGNPPIKERVQKRFADAKDVVQDEIVQIYTQLRTHALLIASLEGRAKDNQEAYLDAKLTEARGGFAHWHGRLDQLEQQITQRVTMYEKRLPQFRAEIERFFGG